MKCAKCNGTGQIHTKIKQDKTITLPPNYISGGTIKKCDVCNGTGEIVKEEQK